MARFTADTRGVQSWANSIRRMMPRTSVAALRSAVGHSARDVIPFAPRDTNRYVRAWGDIANVSGVPTIRPALKAGRFHGVFLPRLRAQLDAQIERLGVVQARYEAVPAARRSTDRAERLRRTVEVQEDRVRRAAEALERWEADATSVQIGLVTRGIWRQRAGKKYLVATRAVTPWAESSNRLIRTFSAELGGRVRYVVTNAGAEAIIHHREPHASIVEKKSGIVKQFRVILATSGPRWARPIMARMMRRGQ